MSLEQFGFVKNTRSATISSAVDSEDQTEDVCKSDDPTAPPSKRRRFNSNWTEGRTWLKHDQNDSMMFYEWCRRFDRNEHRNQFVKGCSSMKLESVKKHEEYNFVSLSLCKQNKKKSTCGDQKFSLATEFED